MYGLAEFPRSLIIRSLPRIARGEEGKFEIFAGEGAASSAHSKSTLSPPLAARAQLRIFRRLAMQAVSITPLCLLFLAETLCWFPLGFSGGAPQSLPLEGKGDRAAVDEVSADEGISLPRERLTFVR